jgi:hypothetical protein
LNLACSIKKQRQGSVKICFELTQTMVFDLELPFQILYHCVAATCFRTRHFDLTKMVCSFLNLKTNNRQVHQLSDAAA